MFTEALNRAVTQTELDAVFFQTFDELVDMGVSVAHANTESLFKPINTTHSAYIEEVYKGGGFFHNIGEVTVVPLTTPAVRNKVTTYVQDFADGIELSKNLFDDNINSPLMGSMQTAYPCVLYKVG